MKDYSDLLATARQRNQIYVAPSRDELAAVGRAARALIDDLAAGRDPSHLRPELAKLELDLVPTALGGHPAFALMEQPEHRRGRGFYVLRCGKPEPRRIVQVPHSFFDEGTLPIGRAVAEDGASALFVNTVHRYPQGSPPEHDKGEDGGSPQDLAHNDDTIWQTITSAALDAWGDPEVIQIHGFADGVDPARPDLQAIVSSGVVTAGAAHASEVATRLGEVVGRDAVALYPRDIKMLGGTKNAQGALLAARGRGTLLHVELSRALRQRLGRETDLLARFATAIVGPGGTRE